MRKPYNLVKFLLLHSRDLQCNRDMQASDGDTLLHRAAMRDVRQYAPEFHADMLGFLLEQKVRIFSPLHWEFKFCY